MGPSFLLLQHACLEGELYLTRPISSMHVLHFLLVNIFKVILEFIVADPRLLTSQQRT